jgi:hypothetical protein
MSNYIQPLYGSYDLLAELQLKADLAETQPVSAASLPLPANAATQTTLALIKAKTDNIPALGQALSAASTPAVLPVAQETALTPKGVIYDVELPLVTGLLTADGVQYSTAVDTTTANIDVDVLNVTIDPLVLGSNTLITIEFGLTAEFRAVSTITADLIWKWQARNNEGIWVDLHGAVTETDIGIGYLSRTRQGKFLVQANLNQAKIDIRLLLQSNELNEGSAKVNSSSYVRLIYT